jgi:hypothetical protein
MLVLHPERLCRDLLKADSWNEFCELRVPLGAYVALDLFFRGVGRFDSRMPRSFHPRETAWLVRDERVRSAWYRSSGFILACTALLACLPMRYRIPAKLVFTIPADDHAADKRSPPCRFPINVRRFLIGRRSGAGLAFCDGVTRHNGSPAGREGFSMPIKTLLF